MKFNSSFSNRNIKILNFQNLNKCMIDFSDNYLFFINRVNFLKYDCFKIMKKNCFLFSLFALNYYFLMCSL